MPAYPKINDNMVTIICEAVSLGMSARLAAKAAHIHPDTLDNWLARGREGKDEACVRFAEKFDKAEAACLESCLKTIREAAAKGTWTAAAWLLERRYPLEYAK